MASVLEAAQTELKAHKEKFRKEPLWSRYGEEFELWVDAIGTWIRHLMITLDSAAAKGFFEASDVLLRQTAATWMRYAKALKMAPARDARRRKLLEDSLNYWMVELNESKVDQHLKELLAICAQTSVKISLGGLHTGETLEGGKVAGTVFGLGVLRGDELELLSIRIHTDIVGLCFMKCL
ncbi:hypothetical protein HK104_002726 [Borealophlyctis nickersoniae]|nr:hypothetical protein HK104_002726 [Borealophlyctis nickersoniae]